MKFISKLTLASLVICSSIYANLHQARELRKSLINTSERKGRDKTPSCVAQMISTPMANFTLATFNQFVNKCTLQDKAFVLEAAIERCVDEKNSESMADYVAFSSSLKQIFTECPPVLNFLNQIQPLKDCTESSKILKTVKTGLEQLDFAFKTSKNMEHRKIAKQGDIKAMLDAKSKISIGNAICTRARNNRTYTNECN